MNAPNPPPSRTLVVLAFAAIYVVWGSTYPAIRVVVETLPPFCAAGVRFLIAGGLLYAFLRLRGVAKSSTAQRRHSAVAGGLLLVGGQRVGDVGRATSFLGLHGAAHRPDSGLVRGSRLVAPRWGASLRDRLKSICADGDGRARCPETAWWRSGHVGRSDS